VLIRRKHVDAPLADEVHLEAHLPRSYDCISGGEHHGFEVQDDFPDQVFSGRLKQGHLFDDLPVDLQGHGGLQGEGQILYHRRLVIAAAALP
jgi:hypothetical protein